MADTPQRLVERLSEEGEKVSTFYRGLAPQQWDVQVYTDGGCWTARQILAHFDVAETYLVKLIQNILEGGNGAPGDFDLDAFNERTVATRKNLLPEKLLAEFAAHRQKTIELVKPLSEQDLEKTGRHPFLGIASLAEIIKLIYRHNQIHLRDIRRVLSQRAGQEHE